MGDIGDYLQKKASQLGLERGGQLTAAQGVLDELFAPAQCRAASLNDGVLKVVVSSASLASEVRMRQVEVLGRLGEEVARLQISQR